MYGGFTRGACCVALALTAGCFSSSRDDGASRADDGAAASGGAATGGQRSPAAGASGAASGEAGSNAGEGAEPTGGVGTAGAGTGAGGAGAASGGGQDGGTAAMSRALSMAECLALLPEPNAACASCLCQENDDVGTGGCRAEIAACMANPDPAFAGLCTDLYACATTTRCSGVNCYMSDTCMIELDASAADYGGFPAGCTDFEPGEAPCPTATSIPTCRDEQSTCAEVCSGVANM